MLKLKPDLGQTSKMGQSKKGEIEKYNKQGIHIGVFDPNTGIQIGEPIFGRRVEK